MMRAALFLWLSFLSSSFGPPRAVRFFDLADQAGQKHAREEWAEAKAVVLFFLSAECPASNGYAPEMLRLAKTYGDKQVLFYGVHSDPELTAEEAAAHAKEYKLPFPVLLDPKQILAGQVGATRVPTAAILSADGKVFYLGRIDDRYVSLGKKRAEPTRRDAQEAIDAILAGRSPATAETPVIGCYLPKIP